MPASPPAPIASQSLLLVPRHHRHTPPFAFGIAGIVPTDELPVPERMIYLLSRTKPNHAPSACFQKKIAVALPEDQRAQSPLLSVPYADASCRVHETSVRNLVAAPESCVC